MTFVFASNIDIRLYGSYISKQAFTDVGGMDKNCTLDRKRDAYR